MVTETMTYREIQKEMERDYNGIIKHKLQDGYNLLKKVVLSSRQNNELIRIKPMLFQSKTTGLKHGIHHYCFGKHDFKKNGPVFVWYSYFYKDYGLYAFMPTTERNGTINNMIIYTPHFFDRYQQRFIKDMTMSRSEVICEFFKNNPSNYPENMWHKKHQDYMFITIKDGVILATKTEDGFIEAKTFLSRDELKTNQIDVNNNNYENLKAYLNKNYNTDIILK